MDIDGVLVIAHSDKQDAAVTWKRTYAHHPLMAFVDRGQVGARSRWLRCCDRGMPGATPPPTASMRSRTPANQQRSPSR